ncbi:MAG: hypothetical protein ACNA8W_25490, partial [Bradymonadaceae bacterium]
VSTKKKFGKVTQCVKFVFDRESDEFEFKLTVYDLFHSKYSTKADPKLIRAEKWFEKNGYGEVKSRGSLEFPVYVSCKEPKKPKKPTPDVGFDGGEEAGKVEEDVDESFVLNFAAGAPQYALVKTTLNDALNI